MADKAANYATYKAMTREDLGDSAKYLKITNKDKNGKKITPVIGIDKEKVNEDLKYAGYNLMVTSELDMEPLQIYQTYHSLWKIEKSSGSQSLIWMHARFTCTKRNNLWAFFNLLPQFVSFKDPGDQMF